MTRPRLLDLFCGAGGAGDHGRDRRRGTDKYGHGTNFVNFHARADSGGEYFPLADRCEAMGIDWMARGELDQAIPPAYTEYIGRQLLDHLAAEGVAS